MPTQSFHVKVCDPSGVAQMQDRIARRLFGDDVVDAADLLATAESLLPRLTAAQCDGLRITMAYGGRAVFGLSRRSTEHFRELGLVARDERHVDMLTDLGRAVADVLAKRGAR